MHCKPVSELVDEDSRWRQVEAHFAALDAGRDGPSAETRASLPPSTTRPALGTPLSSPARISANLSQPRPQVSSLAPSHRLSVTLSPLSYLAAFQSSRSRVRPASLPVLRVFRVQRFHSLLSESPLFHSDELGSLQISKY